MSVLLAELYETKNTDGMVAAAKSAVRNVTKTMTGTVASAGAAQGHSMRFKKAFASVAEPI